MYAKLIGDVHTVSQLKSLAHTDGFDERLRFKDVLIVIIALTIEDVMAVDIQPCVHITPCFRKTQPSEEMKILVASLNRQHCL